MKYVVTHGEREMVVDVRSLDDGRYSVTYDGESHVADLRAAGGRSLFSLLLDQESFEISVVPDEEFQRVGLRAHDLRLRVESEQARNARLVDGAKTAGGPQVVKSAMPGRVVRVLVEPDQAVVTGQSLIILEAMKMENEIRSPAAGRVLEILVKEGATVGSGQVLVRLE